MCEKSSMENIESNLGDTAAYVPDIVEAINIPELAIGIGIGIE